jgi:branched-chain amino acid transport system permease protein
VSTRSALVAIPLTAFIVPITIVRDIAENRVIRELLLSYVSLSIGIGTVLVAILWLRSRQGLALTAILDSEPAAGSIGRLTRRS